MKGCLWVLILVTEAIFIFNTEINKNIPTSSDIFKYQIIQERNKSEYFLNITTVPYRYEITITPYFENNYDPFTFDGVVYIHTVALIIDNKITIHCEELDIYSVYVRFNKYGRKISDPKRRLMCTSPHSFLTIPLTEHLVLNEEYTIMVDFKGKIRSDLHGFYRSSYNEFLEVGKKRPSKKQGDDLVRKSGKRWMASTMFEGGYTRQAFPCFDEPFFKAIFSITIVRPPDYSPSLSNMPIQSIEILSNGLVAETFYDTPVMAAHLIAFVVSPYKVVARNENPSSSITVYAPPYGNNFGDYAVEVAEKYISAMDQYTQLPYFKMAKNMEIKMAVIPESKTLNIENWGLIIFKEQDLLCDPNNVDNWNKQNIAAAISHELAHMWFGNLIGCAWWDNLWLKESFATLFQYYTSDPVFPEFQFMKRFTIEQMHPVMDVDCDSSNTHPLSNRVYSRDEVIAQFNVISYAKGASVLKMTMHMIGKTRFDKAIKYYMNYKKYKVAYPFDLFHALWIMDYGSAKFETEPGLFNISGYEKIKYYKYYYKESWLYQSGYPLLTVTVDQNTGYMNVTQSHFHCTQNPKGDNLYYVPITWCRAGDPDFENLTPSLFLIEKSVIIDKNSTDNEWVIFNKQQSGYYRVNYDSHTWELITKALKSPERTTIHVNNRAQIVDDLFKLARFNVITYTEMLKILSFLEYEDEYTPWVAAVRGYVEMMNIFKYSSYYLAKLKEVIINQAEAVVKRIGLHDRKYEPFMDGLLRQQIMPFLCKLEHHECITTSKHYFDRWEIYGEPVPVNMRPWVYCTALRHGAPSQYEFFLSQVKYFALYNDKSELIDALGCTSDPSKMKYYLNIIVSVDGYMEREFLFENDWFARITTVLYKNSKNLALVFEWLKEYVRTGEISNTWLFFIENILVIMVENAFSEREVNEIAAWLNSEVKMSLHSDIVERLELSFKQGLKAYKHKKEWHDSRFSEVERYIKAVFHVPAPPKVSILLKSDIWIKALTYLFVFGIAAGISCIIINLF